MFILHLHCIFLIYCNILVVLVPTIINIDNALHLLVDILNKNPLVVQYKTHKIVYK
jgi:hypothetical protein